MSDTGVLLLDGWSASLLLKGTEDAGFVHP